MIPRLKSLELHGYKTFATRTVFEFPGAVTAIVGPNGSGKSNIADALRWVLGEQSYSLMRGKKTEDMIFSGSEQRSRAGMASATIVFDNSDHWLPLDFSEVAITRRAYRDGSNEYLINGQRVRLRDVSELLAESGLAERTYTIIGQGLVDAALALKAEERRKLFEEAAGIGLYRARRDDSLRRLEITKRNLERVEDILSELRPRLNSLEKQARRAEEFERAREELREMLREWYGYHWHRMQSEVSGAMETVRVREHALKAAREKQEKLDRDLSEVREKIQKMRVMLNEWHVKSSELHLRRETNNRRLAVAEERARANEENDASIRAQITQIEDEMDVYLENLRRISAEEMQWAQEFSEAKKQRESLESAYQDWKAGLDRVQAELNSIREETIQKEARIVFIQNQVNEAEQLEADLRIERSKLDEEITSIGEQLRMLDEDLVNLDSEKQRIGDTKAAASTRLDEIHREILNLDDQINDIEETKQSQELRIASIKAELEILEQAERTFVGYSEGVKLLVQAGEEARLSGVIGTLSKFIEVKSGFEVPIAAALGDYLDALLVKDDQGVEDALSILENKPARGTILPLNRLSMREVDGIEEFLGDEVQLARKLVTIKGDLTKVLDMVLENTVVVSDRGVARQLLAALEKGRNSQAGTDIRIVTRRGEIFHTRGQVTAGLASNSGVLMRSGRARELKVDLGRIQRQFRQSLEKLAESVSRREDLRIIEEQLGKEIQSYLMEEQEVSRKTGDKEAAIQSLRKQLKLVKDRQDRINTDIETWHKKITSLKSELVEIESSLTQLAQRERLLNESLVRHQKDEIQSDIVHWNTRVAVLERLLQEAQAHREERQRTLEETQNRLARFRAELEKVLANRLRLEEEIASTRIEGRDIEAEIEQLQMQITPAEKELDEAEEIQAALQKEEGKARQSLNQAEHLHTQARIQLVKRQENLEGLRRRIEDDFGLVTFEYAEEISGPNPLPIAGLVEQLPEILQIPPELEETIKRQRALMRRMGPINPDARKEYHEVLERHQFLTSQMSDLRKAAADIQQVIDELDELMDSQFRSTFESAAEEFHRIFSRLFGGGSARLLLTDSKDLTETGIEIEARLPGRREQGLSLLSGGERSLSAVALVFALLRVSPTPFCVLDEVDAMLDETNVGRFGELLKELSQSTQFILITHNRSTVQLADIIYGVTMGRDSTSQTISLKMDEFEKAVQ